MTKEQKGHIGLLFIKREISRDHIFNTRTGWSDLSDSNIPHAIGETRRESDIPEEHVYAALKAFGESNDISKLTCRYRGRPDGRVVKLINESWNVVSAKITSKAASLSVLTKRLVRYNGIDRKTGEHRIRFRVNTHLQECSYISFRSLTIGRKINGRRFTDRRASIQFLMDVGILDYLRGFNLDIFRNTLAHELMKGIPSVTVNEMVGGTNLYDVIKKKFKKEFPKKLIHKIPFDHLRVILRYCSEEDINSFYSNCICKDFYDGDTFKDHLEVSLKLGKGIKINHKTAAEFNNHHATLSDELAVAEGGSLEPSELFPKRIDHDEFDIKRINTSGELLMEGRVMKHCVGSYVNTINRGHSSIYKVQRRNSTNDKTSRYTLQLSIKLKDGHSVIYASQMKGFANNNVEGLSSLMNSTCQDVKSYVDGLGIHCINTPQTQNIWEPTGGINDREFFDELF